MPRVPNVSGRSANIAPTRPPASTGMSIALPTSASLGSQAIAPAVSKQGIEIDGEIVPLTPENAPRIRPGGARRIAPRPRNALPFKRHRTSFAFRRSVMSAGRPAIASIPNRPNSVASPTRPLTNCVNSQPPSPISGSKTACWHRLAEMRAEPRAEKLLAGQEACPALLHVPELDA